MTTHRPPAASTWFFFSSFQDPQGKSRHSQLYHAWIMDAVQSKSERVIATRAQGGEHGASPYCSFQPSPTRRAMVVWSVAALSEWDCNGTMRVLDCSAIESICICIWVHMIYLNHSFISHDIHPTVKFLVYPWFNLTIDCKINDMNRSCGYNLQVYVKNLCSRLFSKTRRKVWPGS